MNLEAFHFLRPAWLLALVLLLPLAWGWRRRRADDGGFRTLCDPHLLPHLLVAGRGRAAWAPFALTALGWTGACLALAGPTWERLPQPTFADPMRTVFVLSLAPSMDRDDVAPSRLARARHKLGDAIDRLEGGAVALVVYREEAYAAVPLTDDADVVREMLPKLRTGLAPGREAWPARGLDEARRLLDPVGADGARVVLVCDGSDASPQATLDAARSLARLGATVSVLSLEPGDAPGLADTATAGGGELAALTADDGDLDRLLAQGSLGSIGARISRSDLEADAWRDWGAWLVWLPLLVASLGFRRGWISAALVLAWIGLPSAPAQAGVADWFERPDQRGAREFEAGRYPESASSFADPAWRAAALYRAGDFDGSAEALRPLEDARSQYNLGNALAHAGRLEDALAAYDRSLTAAPDDEDARFNRDLVLRLLEKQREQPPDAARSGGDGARDESQQGQKSSDGGDADSGDAKSQPEPARNDPGGPAGEGQSEDRNQEGQDASRDPGRQQARSGSRDPGQGQPGERDPDLERDAERGDGRSRPGEATASAPDSQQADADERASAPTADGREADRHSQAQPADGSQAPSERDTAGAQRSRDPWLAHLPDDPGGLLREKLHRDYLRKREARLQGDVP